jgi:mRNA interferase MazF
MASRVAHRVVRGDVRLYSFPPPDKTRPVVVLTRASATAYLSTVTVAPITSTIRGVVSEVALNEEDGMKAPCAVNLHGLVTVSQQRLGRRVAHLSAERMNEICAALRFSLGCGAGGI